MGNICKRSPNNQCLEIVQKEFTENDEICGRIETIVGPMFSGKTTELQRRINKYKFKRDNTIALIKSTHNTRDKGIQSHNGYKLKANFKTKNLMDIVEKLIPYRVIGIDEGHFFDEDLVEFCELMASSGKIVIVAGLDSDYLRRPLEHMTLLMAKSEKVVKLNAFCQYCGVEAAFTVKTEEDNELYKVGGDDIYKAVCRVCHKKYNKN